MEDVGARRGALVQRQRAWPPSPPALLCFSGRIFTIFSLGLNSLLIQHPTPPRWVLQICYMPTDHSQRPVVSHPWGEEAGGREFGVHSLTQIFPSCVTLDNLPHFSVPAPLQINQGSVITVLHWLGCFGMQKIETPPILAKTQRKSILLHNRKFKGRVVFGLRDLPGR